MMSRRFFLSDETKIFLTYLAVVTFGLAQPLFNDIQLFRREFELDLVHTLLIVAFYQYLITAILFAIRYILKKHATTLDFIVIFSLIVSLTRQIQQNYSLILEIDYILKIALIFCFLAIALVGAIFGRKLIFKIGPAFGLLSPVLGIVFLHFCFNHPLPLSGSRSVPPSTSNLPPVMVLGMDELSLEILINKKGQIDATQFPNLNALVNDSVWYREAISHHPFSPLDFLSMFSGRYVIPELSFGFADNIEIAPERSLLRELKSAGYQIKIYSNYFGCSGQLFDCQKYVTARNPLFLWRVFNHFIETFGPEFLLYRYMPFMRAYRLQDEDEVALKFAREASPGKFYFVHRLISHAPYIFNRDGGHLYSKHFALFPWSDNAEALQNYREQLRYMDKQIGELISELKKAKVYDEIVLVLTADHGNCWTDACPGRVYPERIRTVETSLSRIPVIIKAPNLAPRVDDGDYQLVDIFPTIMELLGLPLPYAKELDGRSGVNSTLPSRQRMYFINPTAQPVELGLPTRAASIPKP